MFKYGCLTMVQPISWYRQGYQYGLSYRLIPITDTNKHFLYQGNPYIGRYWYYRPIPIMISVAPCSGADGLNGSASTMWWGLQPVHGLLVLKWQFWQFLSNKCKCWESTRGVSNGFMGPRGSELWGPLSQYNDGTFVMFIARSLESAAAVVAITAQNHGEVTGYGGKLTWIMVSFTRAFKGIESWQTRYFPLVMMASISLSAWNDAIFHKPKASFSTSQFSFAHKST